MEGSRLRGRPKRTWLEIVQRDRKARSLSREDAMNLGRWEEEAGKGWMMISCVSG